MSRKNYTEREKRELLSIVDKYKAIIENKSTNAVTVEKKNETWEKIAHEYNSSAENPRTAKQLNTAYQNLKRLSRQKTAEDNKQNYKENKIKSDILKKLKKEKVEDKKAIMATGGGTFTPQLSEVGAQILALMGDQLKPLTNNCDSATDYFQRLEDEDGQNNEVIIEFDDHKIETSAEPHFNNIEVSGEPPLNNKDMEVSTEPPPKTIKVSAERPLEDKVPKVQNKNVKHIPKCQHKILLNPKKKIGNSSTIKRQFYQKKLECALLEKKTNLINYKISLKKQKLIDLELKMKEMEYTSKTK